MSITSHWHDKDVAEPGMSSSSFSRLKKRAIVCSLYIACTFTNTRNTHEDQIILEEEFSKDSKPDKAARTRIVERVALGEKEVQVYIPIQPTKSSNIAYSQSD